MALVFQVYGVAQPKGNLRAIHMKGMKFPIVTETNRNVKSWAQLVAQGASEAIQRLPEGHRRPLEEGVRLTVAVHLPRPKALMRRGVNPAHLKKPDTSKLVRAIEDALTKVAYVDDSQVVELLAIKRYVGVDDAPHVDIRVEATAGTEPVVVPAAPLPLLEALL